MLNDKERDPLPGTFESTEALAEFWDTHSTADYPEAFEDVEVWSQRRPDSLSNVPPDVRRALYEQSHKRGIPVDELIAELLREQLSLPQPVAA